MAESDPNEEWRAVEGWPYEVSSIGRVRRSAGGASNTFAGRVLTLRLGYSVKGSSYRYYTVGLWQNGKEKRGKVHLLVCAAFHGQRPTTQHDAAHGDGNPLNNRVDNLRWATKKENQADRVRHGTHTRGEKQWRHKLKEADVQEIRVLLTTTDLSHAEIAKRYDVTRANITRIAIGKNWAWLK